jgi:hypothetical protein
MEQSNEIVNRVASSSLITFDLEDYYLPGDRVIIDISSQLYEGLVLREKEFRQFTKDHDWQQYKDKYVIVNCSTDAIVPVWAYMLLASSLQPFALDVIYGRPEELEIYLFRKQLDQVKWHEFANARVVVKGCSKVTVPVAIYLEVAKQLKPFVTSLMFGEPCSTVPLYKKSSTKPAQSD